MATQLVPLQDVERLSASVIRILGGNPGKFTLQGTNTYLLGQGKQRLLIDTGEGKSSWAELLKFVLSKEQATVQDAILTHWHHDHVGGVKDLLQICPDVGVYKSEPDEGQRDIADGQIFRVDGATLRAFHCPGHTTDHMALILSEEDAMFTGDNVLGHGTAVFEDLATYLAGLAKMQHQFAGRAYPAHGEVIEDGKARIVQYIRHRQQREDEILQVLKYGSVGEVEDTPQERKEQSSWTPMDMVKVIYHDVPENLHGPAEKGLIQVMHKLEGEGRVAQDPAGQWRLNGRATL